MNSILLLSLVLAAETQTTAESAKEPEDVNNAVERDGRILIQDNYYSIMNKLEQQEKEIAALKAHQAASPGRVAFLAHQTQAMTPTPNQLIEFNDIRFNVGNAYRHGTFIAPYNGTYLFSVTMCSGPGHFIYVDLLRNSTVINTVLAGNHQWDDCASVTTVTELTSGDDVVVQHRGTHGDFIQAHNDLQSSFTGVLLY